MALRLSKKSLARDEVLHCLLCTHSMTSKDRVTFPGCNHSFCKSCMTKQHQTQQMCKATEDVPNHFNLRNYSSVTCPTCLEICPGSSLKLGDLPVDHIIFRLLDTVKIMKENTGKDSGKCSYCQDSKLRKHKPRWKCMNCQKLFCEKCFLDHEKAYGMASGSSQHIVVKTSHLANKVSFSCDRHSKPVTLYCNHCSMLICDHCVREKGRSHEGHKTQLFRTILQEQKESIPEKQQIISAQIKEKYHKKAIMDKLQDIQQLEYTKTKREIERQVDMLISSIKQIGHNLLDHLEQMHAHAKKLHDNHNAYLDNVIHRLCTLQYFLQELTQEGKEPIVLLHNADLNSHIKAFSSEKTQKLESEACKQMHLLPSYNSDLKVVNNQVHLGDMCQKVHDQVTICPEELAQIPEFFPSSVLHVEKLSWPDSPNMAGERTQPQGLLFTGECLLSAEYRSGLIAAYSHKTGQKSAMRDPEGHFAPRDIALNPKSNVLYVTDEHKRCIKVFDSNGQLVKPKKTMYDQFQAPTGIGITSSEEIVVSDTQKHSVTILSKDGKFIREFDGKGTRAGPFKVPEFIWVDDKDRIIISDRDNNRVCFFNVRGEFLGQFNNANRLRTPTGVCGDEYGNILVADSSNDQICRFYPDGRFRDVIIKFPRGSMHPFGIAMSDNGEIAISDRSTDKIDVYKIYNYN